MVDISRVVTALKEPPTRSPSPAAPAVKPSASRSHLRNDIVGGALTITFFVLVLLLTLAFIRQRDALVSGVFDRIGGVAAAQESRVESYLEDGLAHTGVMVSRPNILNALAEPEVSDDGVLAIERAIGSYNEVVGDVIWISVYDADLELVAATDDDPTAVDSSYLARAMSGFAIGRVVVGPTGEPAHLVAQTVELDDQVLGLVVIGQSTRELEVVTGEYSGLGDTGETIIAQQTSGGDAEFITALRFDADAALKRAVDGSDTVVPVAYTLESGSFASSESVDYRGESVFAVGRLIDDANWALVVKIDRSEALASLDSFLRSGLVALVFGSLLAAGLAWYVAIHIRRPIIDMRDAAAAIAGGARDTRVPNGRLDEIGELADSFNYMAHELNLLTDGLEREISDRTSELEIRNAELRDLIDSKETFLAGVSHEIRSPLTAMIGFLDLARDDSFEATERGPMLDAAMQQADEVLILIEDLLAAARAESGTLKLASVRVNLGAQVAQVVEGLTADQQRALTVSGDEAFALGDPSRARQIIRNLVTNAFRYGGPNIEIHTGVEDGYAVAVVRDDGDGIPDSERENIFEAFGQSSSGRTVSGSVGIGLHVSRQLAELMSGRLTYDHVSGWSEFTLRLPIFSE